MESQEVRVYRHPNPEIRSYLTNEEITKPRLEAFQRPPGEDPELLAKRLGTIGAQVILELTAVPGVQEVRIKPKEVRIRKAPFASWEAMEDQILRILASAVRRSRLRLLRS